MTVTAFQQANQLLREGKLEAAVVVYRQAIDQNPQFYGAYQNLGETLGKLGRLNEAVAAYQKAVALNPSAAWSHFNLGEALEKLGKTEEAIACYRQTVDIKPDFKLLEKVGRVLNHQERSTSNTERDRHQTKKKTIKQVYLIPEVCHKTSLQIVIPSYNRHHLLRKLLTQINREAGDFDIWVDVFDDGSTYPIVEDARNYTNLKGLGVHRYKNHGKKQYWQLVNHIFEYIYKQNVDFFIYMPDDIEICSDFFHQVISRWQAISDPKKIVLNLGLDNRTQCWTRFERVKCKFGEVEVFKSQWVDMLMLFERSFLEALNYRIEPIDLSRWEKNPNLSSGVGQEISQKLHRLGFSLYQVSEYLISHGDHDSMMNPEERKINPLIIADASSPSNQQNNEQSDRQNTNGKNITLDRVDEYLHLAKLKSEQKLWPEALTFYEQAISFKPRADAYFGMAKVLMELGQWEEAITTYRQAITLGLSGEEKPNHLGDTLSELDLYKQIVVELKNAVKLHPESSVIWQLMGDVLQELEHWEEAVAAYRRVIELTSESAWTSAWTHFNLSRALQQLNPEDKKGDVVLVLIPAYNAELTIRDSIYSVLNQTHKFIEIIAIDDCSTDKTFEILKQEEEKHTNIRVIQTPQNMGTYNAVNCGLFLAKNFYFDFYTIHGADDLMFPDKIEAQLRELKTGDFLASMTGYARVDYQTKKHLKSQKRGHSMVIYSKKVFQDIGYYDDTRFGGDTEYLERFITCYSNAKVHNLSKVLSIAYFSPKNLTVSNPDNSQARMDYVSKFKQKHITMKELNNFYVENKAINQIKTSVTITPKPSLIGRYPSNMIVCGVATLPERQNALKDTVESILPQVDKLIIYQNGYKEKFDFLNDDKIEIISSLDTQIDMGDAGKFYRIENHENCYYFSIDDDLIYPSDYVSTLLKTLKKYDYRVIATCHGRVLKPNPKSYYKDAKLMYRCLGNVESEEFVHFGGTGVMAFHTSTVKINFKYFKTSNMADIWMGLYARENNIPILVVPHKSGWILHSDKFDFNKTIYEEHRNRDYIQSELIKNFDATKIIDIQKIEA
jgi:tetratricopeptide (TPR) repeat protein